MKEHHVFGPPGTGKTRYIAEQVERAAEKFGVDHILVSSFTRVAAREIEKRSIRLAKENVGTLHSIAWRALGRPTIAETKADEFNEASGYQISPHRHQIEERGDPDWIATKGDRLLQRYAMIRNRCESIDEIGGLELHGFASAWESWKAETGYLDFCDLIEKAREELNLPPGAPRVAFIDEAQDLSALEFSLVRKWAACMEHAVFVGDDDQALYAWAGADVRNLIGAPAETTITLRRSHRLPRTVHRLAAEFIAKCKIRQAKKFDCRPAEGRVARFDPDRGALTDLIREEVRAGRKVMLLATCSYMLHDHLASLREAGLPWHNPYRPTNGAWNPIRMGPTSTAHKLWCYLQGRMQGGEGPYWTGAQMTLWLQLIHSTGVFRPGGKAELERICANQPANWLGPLDWRATLLFNPFEGWGNMAVADRLRCIVDHLARKYARTASAAMSIALESGVGALVEVPQVIVGTIHSVKGAEADTVILMSDVSRVAMETARIGSIERDGLIWPSEALDPLLRTVYVGMTRARECLYVLPARDPAYRVPYLHKMLPD